LTQALPNPSEGIIHYLDQFFSSEKHDNSIVMIEVIVRFEVFE